MFDEFLSLSEEEQEGFILAGIRGWGKTNTFYSWLDKLIEVHPQYLKMYSKVVNRWIEATNERTV